MKQAYHRTYLDRSLKISVKDPEGNYVAHSGMWFDRNSHLALIEPVCVVPKQRKLGLIPFRTGTIWKRKKRYVLGLQV